MKDCTLWKCSGNVEMENCSPWERRTLEKFLEAWLPREGSHTGPQEEGVWGVFSDIFSPLWSWGWRVTEWLWGGTRHPARVDPPQVHREDVIVNSSFRDSWVLNRTLRSRLNCVSRARNELKEIQLVPAEMPSSSSLALQGVCTVYAFTQHFLPQFPFPLCAGAWKQLIPLWKPYTF